MDRRELQEDWIELILTAKHLGLTPAEVRAFLEQNKSVDKIQQQ
ncbi:anti-repressor SinI family protein [Virgibacillus oceani]|nr:anti-repressor SinI family protein [Virgibacillus oceani]